MGVEIARLLLATGLLVTCTACEAGDKGNAAAPQASAKLALNTIDRSKAGTPAPNVSFEVKPGVKATMARFKGQKVLVNLWATWCAPCIAEMPELDALAAAEKGKVLVIPLSQDLEGWKAVNGFFKPGKFKGVVRGWDWHWV